MLQAILAGDYILSVLSTVLARIGNPQVVSIMSQVVEDLVRGECMYVCVCVCMCVYLLVCECVCERVCDHLCTLISAHTRGNIWK